MCPNSPVQTGPGPLAAHGDITGTFNHRSAHRVAVADPVQPRSGLRAVRDQHVDPPGWFWHENEDPHSLERLFCTYLKSVGANACFHLNLPPNRDGLIDERDVKPPAELGEMIRRGAGHADGGEDSPRGRRRFLAGRMEMELPADAPAPRYVVLEEDLDFGQRVESFRIFSDTNGGEHFPLYQGTTVGHRAVCCLCDPFAGPEPADR